MLAVVLVHPEIPPNTGNVIRLCANSGAELHVVEPLGFRLTDPELRRAGLDYHEYATIRVHRDWASASATLVGERPTAEWYALTTKARRRLHDVAFGPADVLVFGCETRGLPHQVVGGFAEQNRLRLPMRPESRSLNLSNAVAISVYEAWRQLGFPGAA